jgi:hypothetical protein
MMETSWQLPLQSSADLARAYSAIVNTITATAINAQAGLDWLGGQPSDLEEVRRTLNNIICDSIRTGDAVIRLRALMKNEPTLRIETLQSCLGG